MVTRADAVGLVMTSSIPHVSIVIPSYNHAPYLPAAIESVLSQRGVDLELIIVDDGSRDNSWALIEKFAKGDPRIRPMAQRNQGAHAAINAGLREARGNFLAILNSDDLFHSDRIATLLANAEAADGKDFLLTSVQLIDRHGVPITDHPWLDEYATMRRRAVEDGVLAALLERNFAISTSNFFFRRSIYEALGGIRPFRYTMDWDYALRALLHGPDRFAWLADLNLLGYRLHGNNTILQGLPLSALEANHLLYCTLQEHYKVPAAALSGLRRHNRLIRRQQAAQLAAARDSHWDSLLQEAHRGWKEANRGWVATRQEADETHDKLGAALSELAAIRGSRSYRIGHLLASPVRWTRTRLAQRQAPYANIQSKDIGKSLFRRLSLPPTSASIQPKIAVHLHVHYLDPLAELLKTLANLPAPFDLFVTTTNMFEMERARITEHYPQAQVRQCPNQGKDIGPFIETLNHNELDRYDLVLKLHGKKSRNDPNYLRVVRTLFGNDIVDGDDWRRKLISPIAGSPERIGQIFQAFADDPELGMLGAAKFICSAPDADPVAYSKLCERLEISREICFFGGTMFWIRGNILTRLRDAGFTQKDFDPARLGAVESTLEHGFERVFGALVAGQGYYVGGVDDLPERPPET